MVSPLDCCDRPKSGEVFKIKQNLKRQFRSSLRQARLNGLDGPSDRKSWSNVINSSKCVPATVSIIKISDFVAHFTRVFSTFNHSIQSMFSSLLHNTVPRVLRQVHILSISSGDIYRAFKSVKKSSAPDMDGLCYNHFTIKCPLLLTHIQLLFQMCLAQSLVPDSFLSGIVTSVLKKGKDADQCSSYRPITVSCFMSKLFEYAVLPEVLTKCDFSDYQVGFRAGFGCSQAHHILGQLLVSAKMQKRPLYFCSVDISGAFDNVVHSQALHCLVKAGVNSSVVKVLQYWHSNYFF